MLFTLKRKTYRKQFTIPGEYTRVSQWSQQTDLLRSAHSRFMTPTEADMLIRMVQGEYKIPLIRVNWHRGTGRGWGGWRRGAGYLLLPTAGQPGAGESLSPIGRLRLGLILHELAHVIHHRDILAGVKGIDLLAHGATFVRYFDKLLAQEANGVFNHA